MKKNIGWVIFVIVVSILLVVAIVFGSGGGSSAPEPVDTLPATTAAPTQTPLPTATPDPCTEENIKGQVDRIHALTREFEDTAQILTSTLLRDTSVPLVQDLQRVRRAAEDQVVPACLTDLKQFQIAHMNARINVFGTALSFLNQFGPNGDQNALNQALDPFYAAAEESARQYELEYARLLGIPVITATP